MGKDFKDNKGFGNKPKESYKVLNKSYFDNIY